MGILSIIIGSVVGFNIGFVIAGRMKKSNILHRKRMDQMQNELSDGLVYILAQIETDLTALASNSECPESFHGANLVKEKIKLLKSVYTNEN